MPTPPPDLTPSSVATPLSGLPVYCPICAKVPLAGKQTVCSPKCRIQRSMRRRMARQAERDAKVRLLLGEALTLLEPEQESRREQPACTVALGTGDHQWVRVSDRTRPNAF